MRLFTYRVGASWHSVKQSLIVSQCADERYPPNAYILRNIGKRMGGTQIGFVA